MSRIDDALKRVAGVPAAEPRLPSTLERYTSEGPRRDADGQRETRDEGQKIASFVAHGRRGVAGRPGVLKAAPPAPPPPPVVPRPAQREPSQDLKPRIESEPIIDVRPLFDYVSFVGRSVRRHKLLAVATVVLVLAMTGATVALLPRSYHVETKLLAQRNAVMTALSNPGRAIPWDADAPTRAAAETVLRRDNLISLITQLDLLREWDRTRAPLLRSKDWLKALVLQRTPTPDEKLDALVGLLEERMVVVAGAAGDGTVTIELDWPDGEMGYRLVQAAQQAFLDARQIAEAAAINESIGILERYSTSLQGDIDRTFAELQRRPARAASVSSLLRGTASSRTPTTAGLASLASTIGIPHLDPSLDSDADTNRLKAALTEKRRDLARLEETRQRQLAEFRGRLAELKTVYTGNHPSVLSLEQNISAIAQNSPQALSLKAEIDDVQSDYDKQVDEAIDLQVKSQLARRNASAPAQVGRRVPNRVERAPEASQAGDNGGVAEFAGLRLRSELKQLESVLERTDGARIELAVSQAAFKYRYTVIRPAQIPQSPTFPDVRLTVAAGLFVSFWLALLVVVCRDLLSNRILEPWQVERQLGLRLLGTVSA
jgi:uncharacterized protein involved in exopolysaccharide biosynthesis